MMKRTDNVSDWTMQDTSRSPYNAASNILFANLADAENTGSGNNLIDILSNGFRHISTIYNVNGGTYIYAAFAENPFAYSLAR
jgi:hypothetical protein